MKLFIFKASWCGPCKELTRWMEGIKLPFGVEHIDIDTDMETTEKYNIRSVPAVVLLDDEGKVITSAVSLKAIQKVLAELVA